MNGPDNEGLELVEIEDDRLSNFKSPQNGILKKN